MSGRGGGVTKRYYPSVPEQQAEVVNTQAAPVMNDYYVLFPEQSNCRIISCSLEVATAGETLNVRVTIDGVAYLSGNIACGAGADFNVRNFPTLTTLQRFTLAAAAVTIPPLCEGRSVQIELRKTTNAGAGTLTMRTRWARF